MKIIYHHRTLGDGAEGIHIREMILAFRALGHQVLVAGPAGEPSFESSEDKGRTGIAARLKQRLPRSVFEVLEICYTGVCLVQLSWLVLRHQPDFIYDRYMIFNAGPALAGKLFKLPVILEVNAPLALERETQPDEHLGLKKIAHALESWITRQASETVAVSTPLQSYLLDIGVSETRCHVLPNGANPQRFQPEAKSRTLMERLEIPPDHTVIGFSGILRQWHGLDFLIEALGDCEFGKKLFVLIVGDGPARRDVEERLRKSSLSGAHCITGRVPPEEVAGYVNLFDVAVCPRATFYASPMKIVEYMALGKAVLAPRLANMMDLITDGQDGLLFRDRDREDFRVKLETLVDSQQMRRDLGSKARTRVMEELNWESNAGKVISLVQRHLGQGG